MEKREYIEGQLLYIAHPYGGDETNKERVQTYLKTLQAKYPEKTLFSPLHNWGYAPYDKDHQHKPMKDCLEVLQRCNALSSAETGEKAEVVIRNMPLPM